jgi:hypothetical protein
MRPKRNPKPDANHGDIRDGARELGFDVDDVARLPGIYDQVISGLPRWPGYVGFSVGVRVEVKDGNARLTPAEEKYWERQKHNNIIIVRSLDDVLRWFGWIDA